MISEEEKEDMEFNIEAKYVGKTEKEFLNIITYAECLYILNTKNNYCDDIKDLSLLKIVDIISKLQKELEQEKGKDKKLNLENQALFESINCNDDNMLARRYQKLQKELEGRKRATDYWKDQAKTLKIDIHRITEEMTKDEKQNTALLNVMLKNENDKKDKVIDLMAEDIRQVIGDDNYMEMTREETIEKYMKKVEEANE